MARMAPIIQSVKHYVQRPNTSTVSGNLSAISIANAVVAPASGTTSEVQEGSIIKAVYIEFWVKSRNATDGSSMQFNVTVEKRPSNAPGMTFTNMANLGAYPNKKNVFFASQANLGDDETPSVPVLRQWIRIPKGKQRMGLGDDLMLSVSATGANLDTCGVFVYKEYR